MSNGIMEKNLPVAESLGSGDKVRIVTSAGNSKQIDASQIGWGSMVLTLAQDGIEESYNDILSAVNSGIIPVVIIPNGNGGVRVGTVVSLESLPCLDGYKYECALSILGSELVRFYSTNADAPMSFTEPDCGSE